MKWTAGDIPDLDGRTFVVTGANSGLGFETTLALTRRGAEVILACRTEAKAHDAMARIAGALPKAKMSFRALDLASLASIRAFADGLAAERDAIDVLINNAGIMAIPRRTTEDGFEMQLGTNHLGHFALTGLLLPLLENGGAPRIVTVSSMAHRFGAFTPDDLMREHSYERWSAYGQSKLANLLFHFSLTRRLAAAEHPAISVAAHPGYSATNLQHVGPEMDGSSWGAWIMEKANRWLAQSAERGALPQLFAAVHPSVSSGDYYGPNGLSEMWGLPTRVGTSSAARDGASQRALWERSVELTGVDPGI